LPFCEQKKYRRFLYSLLGVASPLSTATPQMGS